MGSLQNIYRARKTAQQVEAQATKPGDMNSIPKTHALEAEGQLSALHTHTIAHTYVFTHAHK